MQKAIPSAVALAQAFADADVLDDYDVSQPRTIPATANIAHFFVDDTECEYEVIVKRRGPHPA